MKLLISRAALARWGALALCLCLWAVPAAAQEALEDIENTCVEQGGQGEPCQTSADCSVNAYATTCIEHRAGDPNSRRCEIPCEQGEGINYTEQPALCSLGETCVEGKASPGRIGYYCQPSRFRMDLNLLDACVRHWLEGTAPASVQRDDNVCALESNLNRLLDQNGDRSFDIFDLDLCVLSFLEQPGCDPQEQSCQAEDLVLCQQDEDCGEGLYCDTARNACTRDCGYIASRESSALVLDRPCAGALKACDYARGRCQSVELEGTTCQVDRDCLAGSYCLLGQCAPHCSRSIDCPDNRWHCAPNNQCRALAAPDANDGFAFNPQDYVVRFARKNLTLSPVEDSDASSLAIIDLRTRAQVRSNPSVSFGYRLEVTYGLKEDSACLKPFVDCDDPEQRQDGESVETCAERQADCIIDDTEEWVRLTSPFGVVTAAGSPSLRLDLNPQAAARLSPGRYVATVRALYDNGDSDSLQVSFTKTTLSGEYDGTLSVGLGRQENSLNREQPITFGMKIRVLDQIARWNELLEERGLDQEEGFTDITQGYLVHASLHGNSSFAFARSGVRRYADNEIPFVGLYSPQLGRMRLLGFIDVAEDFCVGLNGACEDGRDLHARNLLGRDVRRQMEFIGPYDEAGQRFHGVYREKISGLASSYDVTLEGGFRLEQTVADESGLEQLPALLGSTDPVSFPSLSQVNDLLDQELLQACSGRSDELARFGSRSRFEDYLEQATRAGGSESDRAIFPTQVQFSSALETALTLLNSSGEDADRYDQSVLSLHDFLAGRILPCQEGGPVEAGCIDESKARCGLLLYQKALVNGWVNRDAVENHELAGRLPLLCSDTLRPEGCLTSGGEAPEVFAYQEHNLFWFNLAQMMKFDGDHALSDAFLTLYRNQINPFQAGAAVDYKRGRLLDAIGRYDQTTQMMLSPQSAAVMHDWPILAYLQSGNNWLGTMQSVLSDRLNALGELADLSRRVFNTASEDDFLVAQHLMQHEYLYQVYLISLQRDWQGDSFAYEGAAASVFSQGQNVLNQYNPQRNALGVVDGRVYLENDDPTRSNWQHYRELLVGEGGMIPAAQEEIDAAVSNLQGSLQDLDELELHLFLAHEELQRDMDALCGPADDVANLCTRAQMLRAQDDQEWERQFECIFGSNLGESRDDCSDVSDRFTCSDFSFETPWDDRPYDILRDQRDNCREVLKEVNGPSLVQYSDNLQCPFGKAEDNFYVTVRGEQRACVGGEAGALLGERARLDQERLDILGSIATMLRILNADLEVQQRIAEDIHDDFIFRLIRGLIEQGIRTVINVTQTVRSSVSEALEGPDCIFVVGFSNGTDCPQKVTVKTIKATKEIIFGALKNIAEGLLEAEELVREIGLEKTEFYRGLAELEAGFKSAEREIDDYTGQYRLLTTEIYNIDLQLANIEYQVASISNGYADEAEFLFDRLVGRESGSVLFGRQLVASSSQSFRQAHQYTYRMLRAFIHQYNLSTAEATPLVNSLLAAVTLDDLQGIIGELDRLEREYCGREGIDCDASSNTEVLRLSLREALFPNLRDVIDPNSGEVLTAGEQFHNIITSPPWVRRRLFGPYTVDQIELPFSLPLTLQQQGPDGPSWMINPLGCAQFLATEHSLVAYPGNVAVNIKGQNLDDEERQIRYELVRGDTDLVRGCRLESVQDFPGDLPELQYPIRRHIVGYAPQSDLAQRDAPPSYVTRSGPLSSCINQAERGGDLRDSPTCWRYFARGRSLSSLDWRLSIPLQIDSASTENSWLVGEDLPGEDRPIIDDIVLYFRYNARPVGE